MGKIRVVIADDSSFMRKSIGMMLGEDTEIEVVGYARNGSEACQLVKELDPDVLTLDVEMPVMNGIDCLKRIMAENPIPVIMISSLTTEGANNTLTALELGAFDYIPKNLSGSILNIMAIKEMMVQKVREAAKTKNKVKNRRITLQTGAAVRPAVQPVQKTFAGSFREHKISVLVIGTSTGGPTALAKLLSGLPADFPLGILVVQHMPKAFIEPFAERLNSVSKLSVRVAKHGDVISRGVALLAPAGTHMVVEKTNATEVNVKLVNEPSTVSHIPSVDVLFNSAAEVYGGRTLAVILTGMGKDGAAGMLNIRKKGGRTIAQDEESCTVFGMPKMAIELGGVEKIAGIDIIANEIMNIV